MKKSKKKSVVAKVAVCLAAAAMTIAVAFTAGCSIAEYEGEYSYPNQWAPTAPYYGIKVNVKVQTDKKGDRIREVKIVDSDYVSVTETWEDKQVWLDGVDELVTKYRGRYLADVLCETVETDANGQPETRDNQPGQAQTFGGLIVTGATQGSGRLLLAVQDALEKAAKDLGYEFKDGEYEYPNAWSPAAPHYGMKVRVMVRDGIIYGVKKLKSDYVEVSADNAAAGWKSSMWTNYEADAFKKYAGIKVEDVLAVGTTMSTSVPGQVDGLTDENLVIAGATQSSGRLLLAVQNALKK